MQLLRNHMKLEEHARNHHFVRPSDGFTIDDAMTPECWAHVANLVRQWDSIAIAPEDGTWYGEFVVVKVSENSVILARTNYVDLGISIDLETDSGGVPDAYKVEWAGPVHKWRVVRIVDERVLAFGMIKLDAITWAQNDAKASRAAA